jgi:hypothetical protein
VKTPDRRCRECEYWRALAAGSGVKACHYCLDRHELRKRDGKKCLSFAPKDAAHSGAYKPRAMQVRM